MLLPLIADERSFFEATPLTISRCLCGAVKLTKNADPDKYEYSN